MRRNCSGCCISSDRGMRVRRQMLHRKFNSCNHDQAVPSVCRTERMVSPRMENRVAEALWLNDTGAKPGRASHKVWQALPEEARQRWKVSGRAAIKAWTQAIFAPSKSVPTDVDVRGH